MQPFAQPVPCSRLLSYCIIFQANRPCSTDDKIRVSTEYGQGHIQLTRVSVQVSYIDKPFIFTFANILFICNVGKINKNNYRYPNSSFL